MTYEPDTSQPPAQLHSGVSTDMLRLIIRDAVERELLNQIGPLRTQQQVNMGIVQQLNRDYGALTSKFAELDAVVRGDADLGIVGLMANVKSIWDQLKQYDAKLNNLSMYIRVGFAIVIALGLFDNERIAAFIGAILRAAGIGL